MDRAVVHGSTFAKNNLAMAAGLATLQVLQDERLIENAAARGESLISRLKALVPKYELLADVRGRGMMIALELGPPKSLKLRAAWALVDKATKGLYCQMVVLPLFSRHRILSQVAGHDMYVIKLLPPLCLSPSPTKTGSSAPSTTSWPTPTASPAPSGIWQRRSRGMR